MPRIGRLRTTATFGFTRLSQSSWVSAVSGIRHNEYKFEKGYELGDVGSCITANQRVQGLRAPSQFRWFSYNEMTWEETTSLPVRMSGHTGEFTG